MFKVELKKNKTELINVKLLNSKEYPEEDLDYPIDGDIALISEACRRLQDYNLVEFTVGGFGKKSWYVDVWYDLKTVLVQLSMFFDWIDSRETNSFEIDFFAQGTETSLCFNLKHKEVQIEAKSRTDWQPDPYIEKSSLETIDNMFSQVLETFVSEVKENAPDLAENPYFIEWCNNPHIQKRL